MEEKSLREFNAQRSSVLSIEAYGCEGSIASDILCAVSLARVERLVKTSDQDIRFVEKWPKPGVGFSIQKELS